MATTVKEVIEEALMLSPRGICTIVLHGDRLVTVRWSDMPLEIVCHIHRVMGLAIDKVIKEGEYVRKDGKEI